MNTTRRFLQVAGFTMHQALLSIVVVSGVAAGTIATTSQIREAGNDRLVMVRAQRLRGAMQAYMDRVGGASDAWVAAGNDQSRYALLTNFLPGTPTTFTAYLPTGYSATLPAAIPGNPTVIRTTDNTVYNFTTGVFQ